MEAQIVPRLDGEIFNAVDQHDRAALQKIQKGLVAAISAMAPVGALIISRGLEDPALEALSANVLDAFHLIALASNGSSGQRRDQMRPYLQQT